MKEVGWIGVDLDGTLAVYDKWRGNDHIGEPIPLMVVRVKAWLADGKDVRILTARATVKENIPHIEQWCLRNLGVVLKVQFWKDYAMIELWDDRAVQVETNTGRTRSLGFA